MQWLRDESWEFAFRMSSQSDAAAEGVMWEKHFNVYRALSTRLPFQERQKPCVSTVRKFAVTKWAMLTVLVKV